MLVLHRRRVLANVLKEVCRCEREFPVTQRVGAIKSSYVEIEIIAKRVSFARKIG